LSKGLEVVVGVKIFFLAPTTLDFAGKDFLEKMSHANAYMCSLD
jgi:hypothetical protein